MTLKSIVYCFIALCFFASCKNETKKLDTEKPEKKPNILFLLADDMGYGELGVYGQEVMKTPFLDSLASKGMRFTDFYAGTAVCSLQELF